MNKKMNIIITMAGAGLRFKNIGISKPKYEIVANGKTLFEWSLLSLEDFFEDKFIFITRKDPFISEFISENCNYLGIKEYELVSIDRLTDGQATTALYADKYVEDDIGCAIYNIDTYIEQGELLREYILHDYEGYIPAFKADGDRWSFIEIDKDRVVRVTEKIRISEYGTIGFYYFNTWHLFKEVYKKIYSSTYRSEKYIAPMYNVILEGGSKVGYSLIDSNMVHVLGTPEDIGKFDKGYLAANLKFDKGGRV